MTPFTGWQYLLIDVANQYGHDKKLFEERIQWAEDNLNDLEVLLPQAENKPLYQKAVMAIRKAQQGIPSGHLVGLDATCSGIQIMSALTGCVAGATATGLVDPNKRADAYTETTTVMNQILGGVGIVVPRKNAKDALMTTMYGSKATPKAIFGEDTPELNAFYEAAQTVAPGAWELLQDLLASWQPYALEHAWTLPDGFHARVKVMTKVEARIEVDELDHATFTYEFYENLGQKKGLSNAANVVHSVDAYVLREMHRRCNYDAEQIHRTHALLHDSICRGRLSHGAYIWDPKIGYYVDQWERSGLASAVILPHITALNVEFIPWELIAALVEMTGQMIQHRPFPLITVHDEFKAHPNHLNQVRYWYKEILAEIAGSHLIDDLLSQIHGEPGFYTKLSTDLGDKIKRSNYALC